MSLSARRAWIEMLVIRMIQMYMVWSLSARRAWIEMTRMWVFPTPTRVALRKESVDRNTTDKYTDNYIYSRSPQGERG